MFVQLIEGRTNDAAAMRRQFERWENDLRPGATGFLGSTVGVSDDGQAFVMARFESVEAAQANNDRPEQGEWWAETEKFFDGSASFTDSTDVSELIGGGSNDAGFVQVLKSSDIDRDRIEALDADLERVAHHRPDLIGGIRIWTGPGSCTEVAYFTSEAEARDGESAEGPEEVQAMFAEYGDLMGDTEFIDLRDPWLT